MELAKKSILDIEVNDENFQKFLKSFQEYADKLKDQKGEWAKVGEAMDDALSQGLKAMKKSAEEQRKAAHIAGTLWWRAAEGTAAMARNLERVTLSLVRWSSLWGALLGVAGIGGSIFGLERLAFAASGSRRSATGLGLSVGEQKAFGVQFGRYVDEGKLGELQDARYDLSRRGAFAAMGIYDPEGGSAADLAIRMMRRAQSIYRPGMSQQELDASGLGQFFSRDELNRLRGADLGKTEAAYREDVGRLGYNDQTARGWQDFAVKLQEAGQVIEKTLIQGLNKLVENGTLTHLSESVVKLVEAVGQSPKIQHWLEELAAALERFANWLDRGTGMRGSPRRIIERALGVPEWAMHVGGLHNPGNIMVPGTHTLRAYESDAEGLTAIAAQLQRYQRRFHLRTIESILRRYAPEYDEHGRRINDTESYIRDVSKRTGFQRGQALDLSDEEVLAKLVSAITKHENNKSEFTPKDVKIAIENKTGSNVVVNAQQSAVTVKGN